MTVKIRVRYNSAVGGEAVESGQYYCSVSPLVAGH